MTISPRLERNLEILARDAAQHPERMGSYAEFLVTANRANREATPEQRAALRALTQQRTEDGKMLSAEQYTPLIEKIMGWDKEY